MVKYKVFDENKKEIEKTVYLKLKEKEDGIITLVATNENGEIKPAGNILDIVDGKIERRSSIDKALGFDLDFNGRVKFVY